MTTPLAGSGMRAPVGDDQARLRAASKQLEAVFYGQLLAAMRASVPSGGVIEQSSGERMFTAMFDDRVAELASEQSRDGLAEALYRQLSRHLPDAPDAGGMDAPGGGNGGGD